jgi:hypothetical protein
MTLAMTMALGTAGAGLCPQAERFTLSANCFADSLRARFFSFTALAGKGLDGVADKAPFGGLQFINDQRGDVQADEARVSG